MRTVSTQLKAHNAAQAKTHALLIKVARVDGEVYGLTSHDRALEYLGQLYETGVAAPQLAAIVKSAGINIDNSELTGAVSDVISYDDIEAGDWSSARLYIWRVNYKDLTQGHEVLGVGELGQVSHDGNSFRVEFTGRTHRLGRSITRAYLPSCDADLGDARCGVDIEALAVTAVVVAVDSTRVFTAEIDGSPSVAWVEDYHTYGRILWLDGDNVGRGMEVKQQDAAGVFTLQLGMKREIQIGDTFTAYPGCNKLKKTAEGEYEGDCVAKFDNAVNFRGFDEIPGIDKMVRRAGDDRMS
jgi:uncharacterized phage protein (TIGR02218 family)